MAQRVVTSFVNTNIPGAYPNVTVKSNPVGLGASGITVIIGEADGGDSYQNVVLKNNSFTPDQLDRVSQQYVSGQIVDAFRAFSAPSSDADIAGSANRIYIVKTNSSTKASAIVDTDYGILRDQNFGKDGNKYKYQITSIAAEATPEVSGGTIPAFGAALNGAEFQIRLNGLASTTVTLSATAGDHADLATLIIELNSLLPAGITASAGAAANSLKLKINTDATANRKGWGKSFELIDNAADLASLGLAAGLSVSAQEPGVEVAISRPDIGLSENLDVNSDIALFVGYEGTTATMTINAAKTLLTATVTGGSGANLSVDMTQYRTIADLASYIASQTGYSAIASAAAQQQPPSALDSVTAIGIASTAAATRPGRVKSAAANFARVLATSRALEFVPTATAGIPATMANAVFLSGGARGATLAADIVNALNQLAGIQVNIVIPLFSQDATADIADGTTDSGSTYTISAINAAVKSHCIQYSTPKLKKNRICVLSYWNDSYTDAKEVAQGLANFRCSLTIQKVSQVDSTGNIQEFLPWYAACVAAGMQAGGFYKSITNKFANVISFVDPQGLDSGSPSDVEDALDAGLLILTQDTAGNRWVSDQTTYGFDTNFVYNSIQATYCSDILALDLADAFQKAFVGKSLADVDAATAKSFLAQKMDGYKKIKLIAASDDAPLGYKNDKISISGPQMDIQVEVKLATAIYFIPISLSFSQVQSAA
ncbi:MAG: hypothetical protein HC840_00270 [Leptolyngbyaceae cyanobacterium RM2_2_4]|nr:hypothetical protein [Leptolyngbyaceae cyanobacterium RM2_2_4]